MPLSILADKLTLSQMRADYDTQIFAPSYVHKEQGASICDLVASWRFSCLPLANGFSFCDSNTRRRQDSLHLMVLGG